MANILTRLLTLPLTLISLIFTRILRFRGVPYLRLSWPSSSSSSGTNPSSSANGSSGNANGANGDDEQHFIDPTEASEHFVRYLKANDETADGSAVDRDLWFTRGGYNAALTRAKEDNKILLVVLISKEHDDNAAFLSHTLCNRSFKSLISEHRDEIMLWGGDVCSSRDAHIASVVLQTATYPFLSFLSLQPLPSSRITGRPLNASSNKMTVFSRLEGLQATSIPALRAHINETVIPRLGPFLNRLREQKREREVQRRLREEQDRAYAEAGRRDMERVRAKEAELRSKKEAEELLKKEAALKAREQSNRDAWRRLTAASFGPEPSPSTSGSVRLAIRLPDGKRIVRLWAPEEPARRLWYLIDCEANGFPISGNSSRSANVTSALAMDPGYQPSFSFTLATTFPRKVLRLDEVGTKTISTLVSEGLLDKQMGALVVEGLQTGKRTSSVGQGQEAEEESEEEEEE